MALALWVFTAIFLYPAQNKDDVVFWYKLSSFGFSFFYVLNLHFILIVTRKKPARKLIAVMYTPALILIAATYLDVTLFKDFIKRGDSWIFIPAFGEPFFYFYLIYYFVYIFSVIGLIIDWIRKRISRKEKIQGKIIAYGYIVSLIVCTVCDFIIAPRFNIPAMAPMLLIMYEGSTFYAIIKYKFLNIPPSFISDNIIHNLSHPVLLLDQDFSVMEMNGPAREILSGPLKSPDPNSLMKQIMTGEIPAGTAGAGNRANSPGRPVEKTISMKTGGKDICITAVITSIQDEFGDNAGFIVALNENRNSALFQRKFNLTGRQMEVIHHILSGKSMREIAGTTGCSMRTVERHIFNIYNKLAVNNRIELINRAREYDML